MKNVSVLKKGDSIGFFTLEQEIGKGGFGSVWMVKSTEDDLYYALKTERVDAQRHTLQFEVSILKKLQSNERFPRFRVDGRDGDLFYLVMELMGPNLDAIVKRLPGGKIAREFVPTLAHELLVIMEAFHARGYVHRDIKPENFVVRLTDPAPIALIDYGCSKVYIDVNTKKLLEQKERGPAIGTPLYSSPNSHKHMDLSRRDDLYSLMYTILDLAGVPLPWKGVTFQMDAIQKKLDNQLSKLMEALGPSFVEIGRHIESLGFADAPDYKLMRELCLRGAVPTQHLFQWMEAHPSDPNFEKAAKILKNPYDPTGFLIEMAPFMIPEQEKKGGCVLI